jgi:hypothetical protein
MLIGASWAYDTELVGKVLEVCKEHNVPFKKEWHQVKGFPHLQVTIPTKMDIYAVESFLEELRSTIQRKSDR